MAQKVNAAEQAFTPGKYLSPVSPKMRHFSRFVANSQPCRNKSKKFWRKYLEYCPSCCIFAMSIRTNNV